MTLRLLPGQLLLCVVLFSGAAIAADDDSPYLSHIAIERAPDADAEFGATLRSVLHVSDPETSRRLLSDIDGLTIVAYDEDTVTVEYVEKPTVASAPSDRFALSTWVVDFEEDSVQALVNGVAADLGATPTVDELEKYVYEHIANKSYARTFDLASQVAATGEGDCTEHAVLLAALARAKGFQARITFGSLIIDSDAGLAAFGHAWTEIHDGERWQLRDATLPGAEKAVKQLRYLPTTILSNEGPGYALAMLDAMVAMPIRISGVGNP